MKKKTMNVNQLRTIRTQMNAIGHNLGRTSEEFKEVKIKYDELMDLE